MPHKRNPVACMVALAAAQRAPQRVAAMAQEHERALGCWQAELAEWPGLVMSAHGAARPAGGHAAHARQPGGGGQPERTQTMQPDLQFSDAVYGLGAGIFFFTCLIFEVPSN